MGRQPSEYDEQRAIREAVVAHRHSLLASLRQLVREGIRPPVLIFVQSVERAVQLFHELVYDNLNVDVLHADRTPAQREATVSKFRAGKVWVLIATELVARGMDFKGVSLVINYDLPIDHANYIHRVGRSGRYGRKGVAINFLTQEDVRAMAEIEKVYNTKIDEMPQNIADLV